MTAYAASRLERFSPVKHASVFGVLAFVVRLPFFFRYDLHFSGDSATCYLLALRIMRGDRPLYFYSQDYQGAAEAYLTAPLLWLFGPSIPLAASVALLEWSIATGIVVYLARRGTNAFTASVAGIVAVVGVPYTLHYAVVPFVGHPGALLLGMLVLLQAYLILERGLTVRRALAFGGTIGLGLYVGKQCIPAISAAIVALAVFRTPRWSVREAFRPSCMAAAAAAFVTGYLPEIIYRLHHPHWRSFTRIASLPWFLGNLQNLPWAIAAYFDAQPVSRLPDSAYFFAQSQTSVVYPENAVDALLFLVAAITIVLAAAWVLRGYTRTNTAMVLLALPLLLNIAAVLASRESGGSFLNIRRYLYASAILFSIWTGFLAALLLEVRWKAARGLGWVLLAGFVARVWMHEFLLLRAPDELRDHRSIIQDMRAQGLTRGVASWGTALVFDALTNEQIVVAALEPGWIAEYERLVGQAERIAVIGPNDSGKPKDVVIRGVVFSAIAAPHQGERLQWTLYRRRRS